MIQSEFRDSEASETVRFSDRYFCFVVQTFHGACRQAVCAEPVEHQRAVLPERLGNAFEGLDLRSHYRRRPGVEELPGPSGRDVRPEPLEALLQEVTTDDSEVDAKQFPELFMLVFAQVLGSL